MSIPTQKNFHIFTEIQAETKMVFKKIEKSAFSEKIIFHGAPSPTLSEK